MISKIVNPSADKHQTNVFQGLWRLAFTLEKCVVTKHKLVLIKSKVAPLHRGGATFLFGMLWQKTVIQTWFESPVKRKRKAFLCCYLTDLHCCCCWSRFENIWYHHSGTETETEVSKLALYQKTEVLKLIQLWFDWDTTEPGCTILTLIFFPSLLVWQLKKKKIARALVNWRVTVLRWHMQRHHDDDVTLGRVYQHWGQIRRPNMWAFTLFFVYFEGQFFFKVTSQITTMFCFSVPAKIVRVVDLLWYQAQ